MNTYPYGHLPGLAKHPDTLEVLDVNTNNEPIIKHEQQLQRQKGVENMPQQKDKRPKCKTPTNPFGHSNVKTGHMNV